MARDWRFKPASFRGATFYVEQGGGPGGGRRKAIHEYPGAETWDVEDLGAKAKRITLTAYFNSETADRDYAAFVAACDQAGPGELIVPFFPVVSASAESWDPRWTQEKLNYVGAECAFYVENPADAPVPIGLGERILAGLLDSASTTIGSAISTLFAGQLGTSYQRADATSALIDATAAVETIRQSVLLPDDTSAAAAQAIATLVQTAAVAAETDPGVYVSTALTVLDDIAVDAAPEQAGLVFATMAATALTAVSPSLLPQMVPSQAAASIPVATAVAVTMQAIRLSATAPYVDRPSAIAARDMIQALAVAILPAVGALGSEASAAFSDLWGQAATHLSAVIIDLAPIVVMQSNISLPSTVLAYRLYADPSRGVELVARNRVSTPLLMPTLFEAASS